MLNYQRVTPIRWESKIQQKEVTTDFSILNRSLCGLLLVASILQYYAVRRGIIKVEVEHNLDRSHSRPISNRFFYPLGSPSLKRISPHFPQVPQVGTARTWVRNIHPKNGWFLQVSCAWDTLNVAPRVSPLQREYFLAHSSLGAPKPPEIISLMIIYDFPRPYTLLYIYIFIMIIYDYIMFINVYYIWLSIISPCMKHLPTIFRFISIPKKILQMHRTPYLPDSCQAW